MAEPTSILTFYDLILRVAELGGVAYYGATGNERAIIPVDVHEFDRCKRIVNDAIRMFISDAPENGWRWKNRIMSVTFGSVETTRACDSAGDSTSLIDSSLADVYDTDDEIVGYYVYDITQGFYGIVTAYTALTGDITVSEWLDYDGASSSLTPADEDSYSITDVQTVEGDKARYLLSEDFGSVTGKLTYAKDSNRGHDLEWRSEGFIRERREVTVNTGYPRYAAIRRYRSQRRWEIIVDRSPTATDTILFPYEVGFDQLLMEAGIGDAGGTTYITDADRWEPADYFNGWICRIINGTGRGSYATVSDYESRDGSITVFADGTGGTVTVTSAGHGMANGDVVTISGTTNYNGTFVISSVATDTFKITDAWVANDATGSWKQRQIEVADWLKSDGSAGGIDPDSTSVYYIEPAFNKHPAGLLFDNAIKAACEAQVEMRFDELQAGYVGKYYDIDLPRAKDADKRTAPRKLGMMGRGGVRRPGRSWNNPPYYDSDGSLIEA